MRVMTESMIVHQSEPLNAEPPLTQLVAHPVTPAELVYARNHGPIKALDAASFTLTVDGLVARGARYTLAQLRDAFPAAEVVAALQCAGNRRAAMQDKAGKSVAGVLWGQGTIANVRWAACACATSSRVRACVCRSRRALGAACMCASRRMWRRVRRTTGLVRRSRSKRRWVRRGMS